MIIIKGGSAGDREQNENGYGNSIFKPGIKNYKLQTKKEVQVRLLPAFDHSMHSSDGAFATSFSSYRKNGTEQDETKTPAFTDWYINLQTYSFWGHDKLSFISPITGMDIPAKGKDPLYDLYCYVKNAKDNSLDWMIKRGTSLDDQPILRFPSATTIFNGLMTNDNGQLENRLIVSSGSALKDLKNSLKVRAGRDDRVISEEWKEFMLGDITSPTTGAVATIRPKVTGANPNVKSACFFYTHIPESLNGYVAHSFDPNSPQGQGYLAGRYNVFDVENIFKVLTYDDIVKAIIEDGQIPYELIVKVCGHYVSNMPSQNRFAVNNTPQQGFGSGPAQISGFGNSAPAQSGFSTAPATIHTSSFGGAPGFGGAQSSAFGSATTQTAQQHSAQNTVTQSLTANIAVTPQVNETTTAVPDTGEVSELDRLRKLILIDKKGSPADIQRMIQLSGGNL